MARNGKGQEGERNRADRDLRKGPTALPYDNRKTHIKLIDLNSHCGNWGFLFSRHTIKMCCTRITYTCHEASRNPFSPASCGTEIPYQFHNVKDGKWQFRRSLWQNSHCGNFSLAFIAARIHICILLFLLILSRFARQLTNAMLFHQQTHFEEESEFPLWEFELEAKSNQDFNIFLKSDQTRCRSHRIRSRSENSHRGNLINHIVGLIHQYYSNFKSDTKFENKWKQGLAVERW